MASKKPQKLDAADQLKAVSDALKRERQCVNALKEIDDRIAKLENSKRGIQRDLDASKEVLDADPRFTAMARGIMKDLATGETQPVYNPKYVTTADKEKMLSKIIADHQKRHPEATGVSYRNIRHRLVHDYGIPNASTASFFRNELKNFETIGGNKNKMIVFKKWAEERMSHKSSQKRN